LSIILNTPENVLTVLLVMAMLALMLLGEIADSNNRTGQWWSFSITSSVLRLGLAAISNPQPLQYDATSP
jgi:hypothetical protein